MNQFVERVRFHTALLTPESPTEQEWRTVTRERRSKMRFPLGLPAHYRCLGKAAVCGEGRIVNMSSGGVLVACVHAVRVDLRLELRIAWPSLLDGRVGLQLVAVGRVVRCEPSNFAMLLHRHQFRTIRRKDHAPPIRQV